MSIHVCECVHNGRDEYHLRYPGMSKAAAQEIADKINGGALSRKQAQPEQHPDDQAVDAMAAAMKEKLRLAREKGRGGWETCSQKDLSRLLREHVEKGDPRDVANFCAFLHALGFGIEKLEPVEPLKITPAMAKAAADAWLDCGSKLFLNKAAAALKAGIAAAKGGAL